LAATSGSLTAPSINLIDEDDAGSILLGLKRGPRDQLSRWFISWNLSKKCANMCI
jgi:hypothetical protein